MAKKTITTTEFIDDLDGSKAEGTVAFSLNGKSYEIDLSRKNRTTLEKILKPYVDAGRLTPRTRRSKNKTPAAGRSDLADVRAWASANGYEVSQRGRVPNAVLDAYDAR